MKRREFLLGVCLVPGMVVVRPETLPMRDASFEEIGDTVVMTMALPELLRKRDHEAMESIDSGFVTSLFIRLDLREFGGNKVLFRLKRVVKIQRDLWQGHFVVTVAESGQTTARRIFTRKDDAIAHAVRLDRVRVARASALGRGPQGPFYFVEVHAMRNPLPDTSEEAGPDFSRGRGEGRDLKWFSRLVDFLVSEGPLAEQELHLRSNPFFLVPR